MAITRDATRVSDLMLERYLLAELPADEAMRISFRAATDPDVRARLAALQQSDVEISEQYPDDLLARQVADRVARARPSRSPARVAPRWVALAGACAVIVAAVLWIPLPRHPGDGNAASSGVGTLEPDRIKGEIASLMLHRKVGSGSELLTDGQTARRGDLVRVAYRTSSPRFGVIVSIDGRGVVTRHLPVDGGSAVALQQGSPIALEQAYELDDAPRWERFFLVTGEFAFSVQIVLDAASRAAATSRDEAPATLSLPSDLQQSSFLLRKVSEEVGSR